MPSTTQETPHLEDIQTPPPNPLLTKFLEIHNLVFPFEDHAPINNPEKGTRNTIPIKNGLDHFKKESEELVAHASLEESFTYGEALESNLFVQKFLNKWVRPK